jgi:SAM-dependent methyltransferase
MKYIEYAEYYDADIEYNRDISFWIDTAKRFGPKILELACGTGRLLIPLAEQGFYIDGIDLSPGMIKECRNKIEMKKLSDRINVYEDNMADFCLPEKDYGLIFIAFRSFMHLFTQEEQISCLNSISKHLSGNGRLFINVYAPRFDLLIHEKDEEYIEKNSFILPNGNSVKKYERLLVGDIPKQIQKSEYLFEEYNKNGEIVKKTTIPMTTRYTFLFEMKLLLEKCGFMTTNLYGDYDMSEYNGFKEMIIEAQKA